MHNINEELWSFNASKRYKSNTFILNSDFFFSIYTYILIYYITYLKDVLTLEVHFYYEIKKTVKLMYYFMI